LDGWVRHVASHVLTEEVTRDKEMGRNVVMGEGKPL